MDMQRDLSRRVARLEKVMARRMGLRRQGLEGQLCRVRRELPAPVRRDIAALVRAQSLAGNPRIARQLDRRALVEADRRTRAFLTGSALDERRVTDRLRRRAGLLANLGLFAALLAGFLDWQGLI
jgi:hypothetical protein